MTVYNTKEKGLEIYLKNLSSQMLNRNKDIRLLEKEIREHWEIIKSKKIRIKQIREQQRELHRRLNKELRRQAHQ